MLCEASHANHSGPSESRDGLPSSNTARLILRVVTDSGYQSIQTFHRNITSHISSLNSDENPVTVSINTVKLLSGFVCTRNFAYSVPEFFGA